MSFQTGCVAYLCQFPLRCSWLSRHQIELRSTEAGCTSSSPCTHSAFSQDIHDQGDLDPDTCDHTHSSDACDCHTLDRRIPTSLHSICLFAVGSDAQVEP